MNRNKEIKKAFLYLTIILFIPLILYKKFTKKRVNITTSPSYDFYDNKIRVMRIDEVENDADIRIFELTYINIQKGTKNKKIVSEGHHLYDDIKYNTLEIGDVIDNE